MSNLWAVTVRVPPHPKHDPGNKWQGPCPFTGSMCTDITGAHHTMLAQADHAADAGAIALERAAKIGEPDVRITRCEIVQLPAVGIKENGGTTTNG